MAELRKLKQVSLSIDGEVEKYQPLVNISPTVDLHLLVRSRALPQATANGLGLGEGIKE